MRLLSLSFPGAPTPPVQINRQVLLINYPWNPDTGRSRTLSTRSPPNFRIAVDIFSRPRPWATEIGLPIKRRSRKAKKIIIYV